MTEGQWFGLLIIAIGLYFVVCATWKKEFFLYKLKAERASIIWGERGSHIFYQIFGVVMIVGGILQAFGIWVV